MTHWSKAYKLEKILSLVGWFNLLFAQFFFLRVYWVEETEGPDKGKTVEYGIMFPVLPFSGWTYFRGSCLEKYIPKRRWDICIWKKNMFDDHRKG